VPDGRHGLLEESGSIFQIAGLKALEGYQLASIIDGPVEIVPFFFDFDQSLIGIPRVRGLTLSLGFEFFLEEWREFSFPIAHRFVRKSNIFGRKHFDQIT
jgi:hypothetical protein